MLSLDFISVTLCEGGTVLQHILLHIWDAVFSWLYQANMCIQQVNKFMCSAVIEFIKLNMKCIARIPRIACNMGCLDLHGSFPLSALVYLPVLAHLSHEREWLWFWLLDWVLDSCSSPSIQRKALLWSKRAELDFWKLSSSFLFCIENEYGHTIGWQDQILAILLWEKDVMLIPDYLRAFGCWYFFSVRSGSCWSHDKREVRWENICILMGLGPIFIQ